MTVGDALNARTRSLVSDYEIRFWQDHATRAWPTMALIDPRGKVTRLHSGETAFWRTVTEGEFERHEPANLKALNFLLHKSVEGRGTLS